MRRRIAHLGLPLLFLLLCTLSSPAGTFRIVAIGDSWAALMTHPGAGSVLQSTLAEQGYKDVEVLASDDTVVPGSRADQWAANQKGKLDHLRQALAEHPSVDIALVVMGGNDFLREARKRKLSTLATVERARLWFGIRTNVETVVDTILTCRPSLKVVLCDYDYLNLEAISKSPSNQKLMGLSQADLNRYLVELGAQKRRIAQKSERILYVQNWGLMQHVLGDPVYNYGPKTLPAPGGAPDYNPFPGGDPTKPSPAKAFEQIHGNDGIHLNAEGYRQIIRNALQQGMGAMLEATPRKHPEAKPPRLASE